ncbi:MAG: cytosolic protein, partial [Deltaproteobacteria bacterium]|nr:cytosolic protein [Deltaproteobacteria bacterium]
MKKLNLRDVTRYVEENIGAFHQQRIASIDALKLSHVLKRKNPYL